MTTTHDEIEGYLARLRQLAAHEDHVQRFFLFQDEQLADLEYELSSSDQSSEFYDRLLGQFRAWKTEMGEAKWQQVLAHNNTLNGANQNGLIDAV